MDQQPAPPLHTPLRLELEGGAYIVDTLEYVEYDYHKIQEECWVCGHISYYCDEGSWNGRVETTHAGPQPVLGWSITDEVVTPDGASYEG
jgi:hypothetical protein